MTVEIFQKKNCNLSSPFFSIEIFFSRNSRNKNNLLNAKSKAAFASLILFQFFFPGQIKNNFFFLSLSPSLQLYNKISTQIWMFQQDPSQLLLLLLLLLPLGLLFAPQELLTYCRCTADWLTDGISLTHTWLYERPPLSLLFCSLVWFPPFLFSSCVCCSFLQSDEVGICVGVCVWEREREVVNMWGKDRVNKAVRE